MDSMDSMREIRLVCIIKLSSLQKICDQIDVNKSSKFGMCFSHGSFYYENWWCCLYPSKSQRQWDKFEGLLCTFLGVLVVSVGLKPFRLKSWTFAPSSGRKWNKRPHETKQGFFRSEGAGLLLEHQQDLHSLGGGNSKIFHFHPYLGKWSKLTTVIFFRWVETANQSVIESSMKMS